MSVTKEPERLTVKLSSAQALHLIRRLKANEPFEIYGDATVVIERDPLFWIKKEIDDV